MFNNNKILVVIPARDDSGIIPRRNVRLLNNRPLISYSIAVAKASHYVDDVVVTTDDSEIALIAEKFGASVVRHSKDLSGDQFPMESLVYNALIQKEKLAFDEYDIVIKIEPTSPLLKTGTLNKAIEKFEDFSIDTVISIVEDRHLTWGYDASNQRYYPLYSQRVDANHLPRLFKETSAIMATRRSFMREDSCIGANVDVVELSGEESVDIVNNDDWLVAENYLQKKRIAIVVNANDEIGTGYVYRCLSIASKLLFQDVLFFLEEAQALGVDILNSYNYPYRTYNGEDDLLEKLNMFAPQIVINDIRDTSSEYILNLKQRGYFVVNFEDLGVGTEFADVVFDSLYEHDLSESHIFAGSKYFILKDEFYFQPQKIITNEVKNVLIAFEGSDPGNLTEKVLDAVSSTNYDGRINVVLGLGYPDKEGLISKIESNPSIQVYSNVSNISEFMFKADIIFTSAGKYMYEICSLGVPTICLCQNERELTHVFCSNTNGFINMGLGDALDKNDIATKFVDFVNNYEQRIEMNEKMLSIDLKNGFENIWNVINQEYRSFKLQR